MDTVPDNTLLKRVNDKLSRTGAGAQAKVTAAVRAGDVTLSGILQYEIQRRPLLKAATSVAGVRRVIDQMRVELRKRV